VAVSTGAVPGSIRYSNQAVITLLSNINKWIDDINDCVYYKLALHFITNGHMEEIWRTALLPGSMMMAWRFLNNTGSLKENRRLLFV
jgi:hypothetical protein